MRVWLMHSALGHCQSPGLPWGTAPPSGLSEPHCGHVSCLAKTILLWFWHSGLGHCQSPGRPELWGIWGIIIGGAVTFGEPQEGHVAFLPKTILRWLMHSVLGHCQSEAPLPWPLPAAAAPKGIMPMGCIDGIIRGRWKGGRSMPNCGLQPPIIMFPGSMGGSEADRCMALPPSFGGGFGDPQLGHIGFLPKTQFLLLMHEGFGHSQSPGF